MSTKDQAGQILTSPSLPPSGAPTTIVGSGGVPIPATMVGPTAVKNPTTVKSK
jgi:hypothetical protein